MTNRIRIKKFCKEHNLELLSCICDRFTDVAYGDSCQCWDWIIKVNIDGTLIEYSSYKGYTTTQEDVTYMFEDIVEDIKSIRIDKITPNQCMGKVVIE